MRQPNVNVICSVMKSTRCYTKFNNRLQSSINAKIIRTPDTCHTLIWCVSRAYSLRAAVLKGPIDHIDGVFRLDITHLNDKI